VLSRWGRGTVVGGENGGRYGKWEKILKTEMK
jgi:hypothetical protein